MSNLTSLQSIEFGQRCFYSASSFSLIGIIEWMNWEIDLPLLQSVKLGGGAFSYTGSFAMSNLTSLQSIEFGAWCFGGDKYDNRGASSFSLIGIIERMKWEIDLPLLQSVKLGDYAFWRTRSFTMSNLTSLQSIEFGYSCFGGYLERQGSYGGAASFSLIGIIEWMKWEIDLPLLQSVKLGDYAFDVAKSFAMSNLTSLQSIEFGDSCFNGATSFSLIGIVERMKWEIDLPLLQSVKLGNVAFRYTGSFTMSNLTSLQSIEFGAWCFGGYEYKDGTKYGGASSFSLIGIIERMKWEIDLPLLQSVKLGGGAFSGASGRNTINEYPYNYNNTMIMKSDGNWQNVYLDLPSLISFVGVGSDNYRYFGSVVLESVFSLALLSRYSFTAIQQYSVVEFLRCIFASIF